MLQVCADYLRRRTAARAATPLPPGRRVRSSGAAGRPSPTDVALPPRSLEKYFASRTSKGRTPPASAVAPRKPARYRLALRLRAAASIGILPALPAKIGRAHV